MVAGTRVFVFPVVALIADALWEAHELVARTYLGIAITMAGLLVSLSFRARRERLAARATAGDVEPCAAATP
jgi:drug/metabolite transporter (DMT)-like permease